MIGVNRTLKGTIPYWFRSCFIFVVVSTQNWSVCNPNMDPDGNLSHVDILYDSWDWKGAACQTRNGGFHWREVVVYSEEASPAH